MELETILLSTGSLYSSPKLLFHSFGFSNFSLFLEFVSLSSISFCDIFSFLRNSCGVLKIPVRALP